MRLPWVFLALALAGCVASEEEQPNYWFVTVEGAHHEEPPPDVVFMCESAARSWWANHQLRVVQYYDDLVGDFDRSSNFVVGFADVNETGGCPKYTLRGSNGAVSEPLQGYGTLRLAIDGDGRLVVNRDVRLSERQSHIETFAEPADRDGERITVRGNFTVTHHGLWPREGLGPR